LAFCTFGAAILAAAFVPAHGFPLLLVISLAHAAMLAPTTTLADALALRSASQSGNSPGRFEYGWVRGAGSAAFIVGTLVSGQVVNLLGLGSALAAQGLFLLAAAGAAFLVAEVRVPRKDTSQSAKADLAAVSALVWNRPFRRLVLVAAIILGSHAMHDAFAMITWNAAGISPAVGSMLWSGSVAAEVLVFFVLGPWLLRKISPPTAMVIAALAAMLRWAVMAQSPDVLSLALVQPLHGLTFALLHLACMRILVLITPAELAGTAQAVYAFGIVATSALFTFAAGYLYGGFGPGAFLAMSVLAAASLPAIWWLSRALRELPPAERSP
jgi:MFS transporter, PPP family, 3-phenylpropionic acid transporter